MKTSNAALHYYIYIWSNVDIYVQFQRESVVCSSGVWIYICISLLYWYCANWGPGTWGTLGLSIHACTNHQAWLLCILPVHESIHISHMSMSGQLIAITPFHVRIQLQHWSFPEFIRKTFLRVHMHKMLCSYARKDEGNILYGSGIRKLDARTSLSVT